MNNNILYPAIALVVGLIIGGVIIYKYKPRIVSETQVVTKDIVHNQIITVTKTIVTPSGEKETTSTTTDTSTHTNNEVSQIIVAPQYHVSAGANIGFDSVPSYSLQVEKRIAGPIFVGIRGETRGAVGVSIGLEF